MVVPSPPFFSGPPRPMGPQMEPMSKESLRRLALDARKAFVATISDAERTMLEQRLAQNLTSLCTKAKIVGGYAPLGSEISPLLAMEEARAVGADRRLPGLRSSRKAVQVPSRRPARAGTIRDHATEAPVRRSWSPT